MFDGSYACVHTHTHTNLIDCIYLQCVYVYSCCMDGWPRSLSIVVDYEMMVDISFQAALTSLTTN